MPGGIESLIYMLFFIIIICKYLSLFKKKMQNFCMIFNNAVHIYIMFYLCMYMGFVPKINLFVSVFVIPGHHVKKAVDFCHECLNTIAISLLHFSVIE